jgi:transglutaminase-like putative cysteine protease
MQIRLGYELIYDCPQPTPMLLMLNVHYSRAADLVAPDQMLITPDVPRSAYRDGFGNWCTRLMAPQGIVRISADTIIEDSGKPDTVAPSAHQVPVECLPDEALTFLLASRYCETDRLTDTAWRLFGGTPPGWARVQAVCDFVHDQIAFDYQSARPTKSAWEAFAERKGVCRDYAHLAIALCRCLNFPARYCTGYMGDIGVPRVDPMDFSAWFEVYLGDAWYTFDARSNFPRIGRVLIARGRDAADVPISHTFGPATLTGFRVWSDEIVAA